MFYNFVFINIFYTFVFKIINKKAIKMLFKKRKCLSGEIH